MTQEIGCNSAMAVLVGALDKLVEHYASEIDRHGLAA
jgi:hypothetical protein